MNTRTSGGRLVKMGDVYSSVVMSSVPQRARGKATKRRFRSAFTTEQINYLEQQFKKCPYIINRKEISEVLHIPERAIKIWFQNRRMKEKKEISSKECNESTTQKILAKDQLIDMVSSVNEQQYSLPLITDDHTQNDLGVIRNSSIIDNKQRMHEENKRESLLLLGNNYEVPQIKKKKLDSPDYNTSATFSIDLYRKYKKSLMKSSNTSLMYNGPEHNSNKMPKIELNANLFDCNSYHIDTAHDSTPFLNNYGLSDVNLDFLKKDVEATSTGPKNTKPGQISIERETDKYAENEQLIPEDLSSNKSRYSNKSADKETLSNASTFQDETRYISVVPAVPSFYQSYMPANGLIWKPFGLMPVVPTASSPVVLPSSQDYKPKSCCCDCHKSDNTLKFQQQSDGPQYVITMPFQNPSV